MAPPPPARPETSADAARPGADATDAPSPSEALADELRAIAQALIEHEVPDAAAEEALALARRIAPLLLGPPRPRWYQSGTPTSYGGGKANPFEQLSPVRGRLNVTAPRIAFTTEARADGTPIVVGRARLPSRFEGPPGGVHGGLVAALFDELLGAVMGLAPPPGVTAKLEVDYRHLTPIDEDLRFEGWITEDRHRRIRAEATCHAGDTLTAEARGVFVRVDFAEVEERMRARRDAAPGTEDRRDTD